MGKRKTIEEARSIIEGKDGNGCKLLSTEYINNNTKLSILCACGNPFETRLKDFMNGQKQCKECGKEILKQKLKGEKVKFNCDYCGEEHEQNPSAYEKSEHHFCSVECKNKWISENKSGENSPLYDRVKCKCNNCGQDMEITKSQYENSNSHFCSQECKAEWQHKYNGGENNPLYNRIKCECDYCGKKIEITPSRYENSEHHFCSRECKDNYWIENVKTGEEHPRWIEKFIIQCDYCGKDLEPMTQLQINQNEHHYCSRECMGKWRSENVKGENHPSYNPDLTDEEREINRDYPEYKEWIKSIYKRDNYQCQCCGKHGGDLNAHHIYSFTDYEDLRTEIDNGICLCKDCHTELHKEYGYKHTTWQKFRIFLFNKYLQTKDLHLLALIETIDLRFIQLNNKAS